MRTRVLASGGVLVAVLFGLLVALRAEEPPAKAQGSRDSFGDLIGALKKSPGCLGVETAETDSGKQVVFAWFENKKAVLAWYHSDAHQALMNRFFPDAPRHKPLAEVPDDSGPVLTIASITPADKPQFKNSPLPIAQIAIELYQPMPGGVYLGGRFAPQGVKVPKLRDYTPKSQD